MQAARVAAADLVLLEAMALTAGPVRQMQMERSAGPVGSEVRGPEFGRGVVGSSSAGTGCRAAPQRQLDISRHAPWAGLHHQTEWLCWHSECSRGLIESG